MGGGVLPVQASTYQMAILLQYNSANEHSVSHLEACTQLSKVGAM